jgi:hypothetical protein
LNVNFKYHLPAPIWSQVYQLATHEEFMSKFFVKGKFHNNVPDDILNDSLTVERLIEFSYYHYPFLDEAYSKSLRIFEAAIKLRLEYFGYKIKGYEPLSKLMKMLAPHTSEVFFTWWNGTREMRNEVVHNKSGTLLGITVLSKLRLMVNVINSIFLDKEFFDSVDLEFKKLSEQIKIFLGKPLVLNFDSDRYLIRDIFLCFIFQKNGVIQSLWALYPILKTFPKSFKEVHQYNPIFLRLKNIEVSEEKLTGFRLESNEKKSVSITKQPIDIKAFEIHKQLMNTSSEEIKVYYFGILKAKANQEVTNFMYDECW